MIKARSQPWWLNSNNGVSGILGAIHLITVMLPFWTSLLVHTYAWLVLLPRKGIINNWGMEMGPWEAPLKLVHNLSGTLIGMVHIMLPFLILPLYGSMRAIDKNYLKAASNLGARPTQAFWQVFLALSLPGRVAGGLIVFVLCLGFFVTPAGTGRWPRRWAPWRPTACLYQTSGSPISCS
jgi:ABC-type spermidine/putrescine transport system permease subunit I